MGVVIRPAAFTSSRAERLLDPDQARDRRRHPLSREYRPDGQFLAIVIAVAALTWIFALAGAAFAIRALLVLCFATLAGRGRRIGVPAVAADSKIARYSRDA
jgi:hypothetical protein